MKKLKINKYVKVIGVAAITLLLLGMLDYFLWYKTPIDCGTINTVNATPYDTNIKVSGSDYQKLNSCFLARYGGLRSTSIGIKNSQKDSANTYVFTYKGARVSGLSDSYNQYGSAKYGFKCFSVTEDSSSVTFDCEAVKNYKVSPI